MSNDLRTALRSVTQPVVVVTGRGASGPAGLTVSSFASVSTKPAAGAVLCRMHTRRRSGDHEVVVGFVEDSLLLSDGVGLDSHTVRESRLPVG